MKVLHIVPSFYPAHVYGGPIESAYKLCLHLAGLECIVRVLTTDANGSNQVLAVETRREVVMKQNLKIRYCRRRFLHTVSPMLLRLLPGVIRSADVVHLTAVYSFPTIPTLMLCRLLDKPVIWSPQGALQRWEGSTRVLMKAVWEWICRAIAPKRLVLHVTSEEEARASLKRFPGVKTVIIPNGVEIPENVAHVHRNGILRLLYLGRLHPIKRIENLLIACEMLNDSFGETWLLTIAGGGDRIYTETIRTRVQELGLTRQVKLIGEVIGEAKERLFADADLVVVPSQSESFGMVVAEALAHGVPVIASKGTPWQRVEEMGCGLWLNNDSENLAKAIEQMGRMPLREMGNRGHEWMEREFSWDKSAKEMLACYETLCGGFRSRQETR